MYEKFYGFKEKPFQVVPNLDYLYLSDKHRNALTYLQYRLAENMGFIMLTGEIGSGKTTLIHYMLERLESAAEVAFIFNTNGSQDQLLGLILNEFKLSPKKGRAATLDAINQFLIQQHSEQKQVLIVFDEAQNLTAAALEEVRMLSNLQTENQAFLKIMLVGEPDLIDKIKDYKLHQFTQRIAAHYHLTGLDRKETGKYIGFRLQKAGGVPDLFTSEAIETIYRITRGIPRSINLLCQAALVYGYAAETRRIGNMVIEQITRDKIGIGLESQIADISASDAVESKKEDEIIQRLRILEEKHNALQGYIQSQLQLKELNNGNFKDNLISTLLQLLIDERRRSEELLLRYSQPNLNYKNLKRSEIAIQNQKGSKQAEDEASGCVPFSKKKRSRFSD
jgi:general secretion pathway protein A